MALRCHVRLKKAAAISAPVWNKYSPERFAFLQLRCDSSADEKWGVSEKLNYHSIHQEQFCELGHGGEGRPDRNCFSCEILFCMKKKIFHSDLTSRFCSHQFAVFAFPRGNYFPTFPKILLCFSFIVFQFC